MLSDDLLTQARQPGRVDEAGDGVQVDRLIDRPHLRPAGGDQRLHFVQTTAARRRRRCGVSRRGDLRKLHVN